MSKGLDEKQVLKAVRALLKHVKATKGSSDLLDEENIISLQIGFKQTPDHHRAAKQIPLPHTLHTPGSTAICLITKDPEADFEALLKEKGVAGDITVLGVSKLRSDYKPFEAKRQLCQMYDLFLADDRVVPLLPKLLGKKFYETKKRPTKVDLRKKNLEAEIARARDSTALFLGQGPCSGVKVGHSAQTAEQLVENIMAVAEKTKTYVRKNGIQAMHIKTSASVALPIYNDLPTFEDLQPDPESKQKPFYTTEAFEKKKAASKRKREGEGDEGVDEGVVADSGKDAGVVAGSGKKAEGKKGKKPAADAAAIPNKAKKAKTATSTKKKAEPETKKTPGKKKKVATKTPTKKKAEPETKKTPGKKKKVATKKKAEPETKKTPGKKKKVATKTPTKKKASGSK